MMSNTSPATCHIRKANRANHLPRQTVREGTIIFSLEQVCTIISTRNATPCNKISRAYPSPILIKCLDTFQVSCHREHRLIRQHMPRMCQLESCPSFRKLDGLIARSVRRRVLVSSSIASLLLIQNPYCRVRTRSRRPFQARPSD